MAEPGAKLRIEQPTLSPRTTRVWLNEQELSSCVTSVSLESGADRVTEATLTIAVGELEIDATVLVSLIGRTQDPALIEQAIRDLKQITSMRRPPSSQSQSDVAIRANKRSTRPAPVFGEIACDSRSRSARTRGSAVLSGVSMPTAPRPGAVATATMGSWWRGRMRRF
jgi:hypothetical protein